PKCQHRPSWEDSILDCGWPPSCQESKVSSSAHLLVMQGEGLNQGLCLPAACGTGNDGQPRGLWLAAWMRHRCGFRGTKDYEHQHGLHSSTDHGSLSRGQLRK
ncbi:mCG145883, isoform CRA_a, partial [Mus musculus]